MKTYFFFLSLFFLVKLTLSQNPIQIHISPVLEDSISVRAIAFTETHLFYSGDNGKYGYINLKNPKDKIQYRIENDSVFPGFRAVASTKNAQYLLSIAHPALLYKTNISGSHELMYIEDDPLVFYDSMAFWNEREGLAFGDPTQDCMSVIITRNGGNSWEKVPCEKLSPIEEGEVAFAASNSNISIINEKIWMISGGTKSRVYFSEDKGKTWEIYETPLVQGKPTTGGYSIDFYDENKGFIIGGDYTQPEENQKNKAISTDGGKTWSLVSRGNPPGYKSCVQFAPNQEGKKLIAVGPSGISASIDEGKTWKKISDEGFYTLRFLDDSTAYAAGKNKISKIAFKW